MTASGGARNALFVHAARSLLAQRYLALLLCVATLLLKLLVPTGYMIARDHGRIAITVCPGMVAQDAPHAMAAMPGHMPDHGKSGEFGKVEMPCAFSGLSAAALGAIDPLLLVGLIAFIMAFGVSPAVFPAPEKRRYLRPPLRGPPACLRP